MAARGGALPPVRVAGLDGPYVPRPGWQCRAGGYTNLKPGGLWLVVGGRRLTTQASHFAVKPKAWSPEPGARFRTVRKKC